MVICVQTEVYSAAEIVCCVLFIIVCVCVFSSTWCSCAQTLPVLNGFLAALCIRLAELVDPRDAAYTSEVLSPQLPHIKGSNARWSHHALLTPDALGGGDVVAACMQGPLRTCLHSSRWGLLRPLPHTLEGEVLKGWDLQ